MQNAQGSWGDYFELEIQTRAGVEKVIVDFDQAEKVTKITRWGIYKDPKGRKMARAGKEDGQVLLHRYLFDIPQGYRLEWINGKTLDCRRKNLQLVHAKTGQTIPLYEPEIRVRKPGRTGGERHVTDPNSTFEALKNAAEEGITEAVKIMDKLEPKKKSETKGVYFHKASNRWHAAAFFEGKRYSLGYFQTEIEAIEEVTTFRALGPDSPNLKRNQRKGN